MITDECPDPDTPPHSPLLGNVDAILVCIRFGTAYSEIKHQVKPAGKVVIISPWRRYRRHKGAGSSQSSASILGSRDTGGLEEHHSGQWTKLMSWVMMKGKTIWKIWSDLLEMAIGAVIISPILVFHAKQTNKWEEYCSAVVNNNTTIYYGSQQMVGNCTLMGQAKGLLGTKSNYVFKVLNQNDYF